MSTCRWVYVIELSDGLGERADPRLPWLYVGESSRRPEKRFAQHKAGYKASRHVKKFGLRLRPELYEDLLPAQGVPEAQEMEDRRAVELSTAGHRVVSNGTRDPVPSAMRRPFDRAQLEPVIHLLDAAILGVVSRAPSPIGAAMCAHVLWSSPGPAAGGQGFREIPEYGRFGHVRENVLKDRISELVTRGELGLTEDEWPKLFVPPTNSKRD